MNASPPLLRMEGIKKAFPGVRALGGVDLEAFSGQVLALLGENGAGKSTLIKVLAGAHSQDSGTIRIDNQRVEFPNPLAAQLAGIAVIYQEFNLVPQLTARENIFLGSEQSNVGFVHHRNENRRARELFDRIGVQIDPESRCRDLSIAHQQAVEIAKALSRKARILVMDEPTATLTNLEVEHFFKIVRELKAQNLALIFISHRLDEIFDIADRVTVLRDGMHVASHQVHAVDREELIELMVGRKLENEFPKRPAVLGEPRLVVKQLSRGSKVRNVSFSIRSGEVLGLTGLVGAGRTELARLIFAADRLDAGTIQKDGKHLRLKNPNDAIKAGIALLTEDRKSQGLVLGRSVQENFALPNLAWESRWGFVNTRKENDTFASFVKSLRIRISDGDQLARNLSGGNQQKVVLAKWLHRNCDIILFDEPTRGIDIGAKYEVYQLMNDLANNGKAILMISSELPEILGMSDRILVMHQGQIAGEITDVMNATQEQILNMAIG